MHGEACAFLAGRDARPDPRIAGPRRATAAAPARAQGREAADDVGDQGMISFCPMLSEFRFSRLLIEASASTLVPYRRAMLPSVSPGATV